MKKKASFKERFRYWFDRRMSRGTVSMIKLLAIVTLVVVIVLAILISVSDGEEENLGTSIWDTIATAINAWMPYSEDGNTFVSIILTAVAAIVGLFFTSVLIGIVGSAIEDKLTELRKGNSKILEEGHIVLLGFKPGEFTLLSQLILSAGDEKRCIVVADNVEKDEMEESIKSSIEDIPKNVRIICRNVDTCDVFSLGCCAIPDASTVVVNKSDDAVTIKSILAVSAILEEAGNTTTRIVAAVSARQSLLPKTMRRERNIIMLQTNDVIARTIAHSCTQPGISHAFVDTFNFEGNEMYFVNASDHMTGRTFMDISLSMNGGVPLGIARDDAVMLKPDPDTVIEANDRILYLAEDNDIFGFIDKAELVRQTLSSESPQVVTSEETERKHIVIIGYNSSFGTIINELSIEDVSITVADIAEEVADDVREALAEVQNAVIFRGDVNERESMEELVRDADHIVILSPDDADEDNDDLHNIMILLKLRDTKLRNGYKYSITAELFSEKNRRLVSGDEPTDFVIASDISAMVLAQLAETPELYSVFKELLSNDGNELCLKPAAFFGCAGTYSVAELRRAALKHGYCLIGYQPAGAGDNRLYLNPSLTETLSLVPGDNLVVIGEQT